MPASSIEGKRVLFISYNGMLDPLGQSQVIPYLQVLSREAGVQFTLLSFEREAAFAPEGKQRCEDLRQQLAQDHIEWHQLRYHKRPSLPATIYDVAMGVRYAKRLVPKNRIEIVHARSHIPATMALALKREFGVKMIFDVRGLMADEYVDAGHWRKGSLPFRLTKRMERRAFAAADGLVTLTDAIWPLIREWDGLRGRALAHQVIPCCTDLERFRFDPEARAARRAEMKAQGRFVIVYSGSLGGWYLTEAMADFFAVVLKEREDAHFLWLTTAARESIDRMMRERAIGPDRYTVRSATNAEVPSYLSASDAGLAFIKPCFSKLASSPTKTAEYLACGLPIVINAGVGDADALVTGEGVGALVHDLTPSEYRKAAAAIKELLREGEAARERARAVARRLFDVRGIGLERYARLYEQVSRSEDGLRQTAAGDEDEVVTGSE